MKAAFFRTGDFDSTPAIERAVEACRAHCKRILILEWDRTGQQRSDRSLPPGCELRTFRHPVHPGILHTLLMTMAYQVWLFVQLIRFRPRVVQPLSLECAIPAVWIKLLVGARLIYDLRDPAALSYDWHVAVRRCVYVFDWVVMGFANAFVSPASSRKGYVGRWGRRREYFVIPNSTRDYVGELPGEVPELPRTSGMVRIALLGYISEARGIGALLDFCSQPGSGAQLVVAGRVRDPRLRERLEESDSSRYLGFLPKRSAAAVMRDSHAVAVLYDPDLPINRLAEPTKFYEAMMVGTPVLVSSGMHVATTVREHGLGYVIPYGNLDALADVVRELGGEATRDEYRRHCRDFFIEHLTLDRHLVRYAEFYARVLAP